MTNRRRDRSNAEPAPEASIACAQAVIGALIAGGVGEVILAPGSRSAPFAYVLDAADRAGLVRLHVRIDERGAGFLALGLAKASGRPVGVVTTSGTAAANLHPAVLEAAAAGVPLIAITADRPAALRNSGANQTTDQLQLFGSQVRGFAAIEDSWGSVDALQAEVARLLALASGTRTRLPGPVHLNVAFDDPLLPATSVSSAGAPAATVLPIIGSRQVVQGAATAEPLRLSPGPRTVVVAGDAPPALGRSCSDQCARAAVPLLAEPSSNARRHPALATARLLLGTPLADEIERAVVVGRPTLSRPVAALLARRDVELIVVSAGADWPDPGLRRPTVVDAVAFEPDGIESAGDDEPGRIGGPSGPAGWLHRWIEADARLVAALGDLLGSAQELTGLALARTLIAALPAGAPLMLGSSNPIRDVDLAPIRDDLGPVYANRGLAGIDGTLSSAIGIALAHGAPTHALVGDLTFLHDLTGLVIGPEEARPDLRIVVANDDGGSIFATLEHGRPEHASAHERVFGTPHHAELPALAGGLNLPCTRVTTAESLVEAITSPPRGIEIVEAIIDRAGRRALDQAIGGLVTGLAATP